MFAAIGTSVQRKERSSRTRPPSLASSDHLFDPLSEIQRQAEIGTRGGGGKLPHFDQIQAAFGAHDLSGVRAHTGADASAATDAMGAEAYATGSDLAFSGAPSLYVAAHEAAHVVQQQGGVHLKGGVGESGDRYERQANDVASAVVRGESAEPLLDQLAGSGGGAEAPVQMFSLNPIKGIKKLARMWSQRKQRRNQAKMDKKGEELRDDRDRWLVDQREGLTIENAYEEGDLFYGLSHPREQVMRKVAPDLENHMETYDEEGNVTAPQKAPMFLDTINNMFLGTGTAANNVGKNKWSKQFQKESETYQGEKENEIPEVKGFREFLEGHDHYNPKMAPGQEQWGTRIGRACKGGLEYTTTELNKKIHFVLDKYDFSYLWDDINKRGEDRAITSKELKWLFRNWDNESVASNVLFWRDGKVVLPPWVEDPMPWTNYKTWRANKNKN